MRRSVAPSQLNSAAKRPRFSTPFSGQDTEKSTKVNIVSEKQDKRSTIEVLQLIQGNFKDNVNNFSDDTAVIKETTKATLIDKSEIVSTKNISKNSDGASLKINEIDKDGSRYYNVVWCKLSKKKHKNWEGDAILIVKGRTATVKDTEGKQIGQACGYKLKDLENLDEGSTLVVGGKEVEIMNAIKKSDFTNGSCFLSDSTQTSTQAPKNIKFIPRILKPLYDPTKPNALVLPPPNDNHQQLYNIKKLPLVDVVVDPRLTVNMRVHQKEGVVFLYECIMGMRDYTGSGAILADEMGLGKTLQCIALVWTLLKQGPYGGRPVFKKVLIATPGSLVQNWVKEFNKWLGKGRIFLYAVDSRHPVKDFYKTPCCPVMIISYEMLMRSCDIVETMNFDLIICDEGHRLKNTSVKTTSVISRLGIKKRILLTGTPVQNDLQEFFGLVEFCNPGVLGTRSYFSRRFEKPITLSRQPDASNEEKNVGENQAEELMHLTNLFILRRTQDVINKYLPPKVENVIFCKPSTLQISLIKTVLKSTLIQNCLRTSLQMSESSTHPFICISALKKICNHPALFLKQEDKNLRHENLSDDEEIPTTDLYHEVIQNFPLNLRNELFNEELSGKMNVLDRILSFSHQNESNERFVLVSGFTKTLNIFQQFCHKNNYLFLRLDGSTPTAKRQGIVDMFNQNNSYFIFLLSSKAGGVGFNLIGASRIILFDIDWNPANDLQSMARVWRDGQKKTVHIYRFLTTGTLEEKIFQRQVSKQNLSDAVMDKLSNSKIQFSKEELRDLFTFHEFTNSTTHDLLNCECLKETSEIKDADENSPVKQKKLRKINSNLNMNELLQWRHFSIPISCSEIDDKFLESASDHISFVFQTKSNQAALPCD